MTAITIHVAAGRVTGYQGTRFGGFAAVPAAGQQRAWVRISIRDGTGEFDADLREGDTRRAEGHTWQLDKIHNPGTTTWHADLSMLTRSGHADATTHDSGTCSR